MIAHVAGTEPYPWPYDGRLHGPHVALVVVGFDEQWSGRALGSPSAITMASHRLAEGVMAMGGTVITLSHGGAAPLPRLSPGTVPVTADGIDGFHGGPLDGVLRRAGCTHLLLSGFGLEGPVHSTLRSANDRGYECLLVRDATAPLIATLVDAAISTVLMSGGIFGAVGLADAVAAALSPSSQPAPQEASQ